jgi:hypothetical protein
VGVRRSASFYIGCKRYNLLFPTLEFDGQYPTLPNGSRQHRWLIGPETAKEWEGIGDILV